MSDFFEGWVQSDDARGDSICLNRLYIDMCDGNFYDAAIFTRIMFWHGYNKHGQPRLKVFKAGHLWLAKRYEDWQEECHVDAATARKCIDRLIKKGLILKEVFHFEKKPTVHLRVNKEVFEIMFRRLSDTVGQIGSMCPNVSDANDTIGQMDVPQRIRYINSSKQTDSTNIKDSAAGATRARAIDALRADFESSRLFRELDEQQTTRNARIPNPPQSSAKVPPAEEELPLRPTYFTVFEDNIGALTPIVVDTLKDAEREYTLEWVEDAIRETAKSGGKSVNYAIRILERWKREGRRGAKILKHPGAPPPRARAAGDNSPPAKPVTKGVGVPYAAFKAIEEKQRNGNR